MLGKQISKTNETTAAIDLNEIRKHARGQGLICTIQIARVFFKYITNMHIFQQHLTEGRIN